MKTRRFIQVVKYGWIHSKQIAQNNSVGRLSIFKEILKCYLKYRMWSSQYLKEEFWTLDKEKRDQIGELYMKKNTHDDLIKTDKLENRRFLNKWSKYYWELGYENRRKKRQLAYAKRYNMGNNCDISYDVVIERNHFLDGTINVGNNVMFGKHTYIDYSGEVVIGNDVQLANGVIIESHHHPFHSDPFVSRELVEQTRIEICDGVVIGSRAIILASCHYIGKNARVGAGAVVTRDVPDGCIVVGVPARVIKSVF